MLQDYKIGLFGYFDPDNYKIEELIDLLKHAKNLRDFRKELPKTTVRHFSGVGFEKVVGISKEMLKVYHLMCQIKSKEDVTTILYGESGTGKNLIAQTLHNISLRRENPNIAVNCPCNPSRPFGK